jgi:hypothetical protein
MYYDWVCLHRHADRGRDKLDESTALPGIHVHELSTQPSNLLKVAKPATCEPKRMDSHHTTLYSSTDLLLVLRPHGSWSNYFLKFCFIPFEITPSATCDIIVSQIETCTSCITQALHAEQDGKRSWTVKTTVANERQTESYSFC